VRFCSSFSHSHLYLFFLSKTLSLKPARERRVFIKFVCALSTNFRAIPHEYHRRRRHQHQLQQKIHGSHGDAFAPDSQRADRACSQVWSALRATGSRLRQIYHPLVLRIADPPRTPPWARRGAWRRGRVCARCLQTPPAPSLSLSPWQPNFDPVTASRRHKRGSDFSACIRTRGFCYSLSLTNGGTRSALVPISICAV
jgi:hypothetical protein